MRKLNRVAVRQLTQAFIEEINDEKRYEFMAYGDGGRYTAQQKEYAFELIREYGVRATAKILHLPRRTLQRWCRQYRVYVKRCPEWVYGWAERRRKRKEFWARRGYF